uniref:BTB domain-containing protein n=1 Tax=Coccidioides posadasii RMSCC 3488 TaxID=454284 RepID=A0A0J6HXY8_COCPO|nr:hypothetical protein CPAG_00176 [Coccidioides posadasii RMSCC 3488]
METEAHSPSERVVLRVGESQYFTTVGTLVEKSQYFKSYFSGAWPIEKEEDGSIFIEGDPHAFDYVMQYLRRGTFPLAFDVQRGHNYSMYSRVLEEAKYFQCPLLVAWLEDACYNKCVTWRVKTTIQEATELASSGNGSTRDPKFSPYSKCAEKVYECPRGILGHRGGEACGRKCRKAQGNDPREFDTESTIEKWIVARTEYLPHLGWMTDSGRDFLAHLATRPTLDMNPGLCERAFTSRRMKALLCYLLLF